VAERKVRFDRRFFSHSGFQASSDTTIYDMADQAESSISTIGETSGREHYVTEPFGKGYPAMKAMRCKEHGAPQTLTVENLPALKPGAGEVMVRVK
jgi:hypothetical protein